MEAVAERELYTGRVPARYQDKLRERRRVADVVADLVASSRKVALPSGVVTLVDPVFLDELAAVTAQTGERLYAVVDELHLARVAQAAGLIETTPATLAFQRPDDAIAPGDIKAVRAWKGWTQKQLAAHVGTTNTYVCEWEGGVRSPRGEKRAALAALIAEMKAAQAAEQGAPA